MADNIRRYQNNTHPFKATINKDGDYSLAGMTVEMVFKIGNNPTHNLAGDIQDEANGVVWFVPTVASVADKGVGQYEINVDDGTYEVTYLSDDIEILKRVGS